MAFQFENKAAFKTSITQSQVDSHCSVCQRIQNADSANYSAQESADESADEKMGWWISLDSYLRTIPQIIDLTIKE